MSVALSLPTHSLGPTSSSLSIWRTGCPPPDPGLLPSSKSASLGETGVRFALQLGELDQVQMSLYLRGIFVSLTQCHSGTGPQWEALACFFPRDLRTSSGQCFGFSPLPNSSRSHSSWCAFQEITFWGICFSRQLMALILFLDVFRLL